MTFNDISTKLLSKDNCALLIGRGFFVDNLHTFVRGSVKIVRTIDNPHESDRAKMLKQQLVYILENYDKARRLPVGSKKPR